MNCTICGKPVTLCPSAAERAAKDVTGKSAAYYTNLFRTHSECELKKRAEGVAELCRRLRAEEERLNAAGFYIYRRHT